MLWKHWVISSVPLYGKLDCVGMGAAQFLRYWKKLSAYALYADFDDFRLESKETSDIALEAKEDTSWLVYDHYTIFITTMIFV